MQLMPKRGRRNCSPPPDVQPRRRAASCRCRPVRRRAKRIAEACGLRSARRDDRVLAECGDAGAALPLLLLARRTRSRCARRTDRGDRHRPRRRCRAAARRSRRARRARLHRPKRLPRKRDESSYVRYLSHRGLLDVDFGMRAERDQRTAHTRGLPQTRRAERLQRRPLRALRHGAVSAVRASASIPMPRQRHSGAVSARRFARTRQVLHRGLAGVCRHGRPTCTATSNSPRAAIYSWNSPTLSRRTQGRRCRAFRVSHQG